MDLPIRLKVKLKQMNSLISSGDSEAEILLVDATTSIHWWNCAVGAINGYLLLLLQKCGYQLHVVF